MMVRGRRAGLLALISLVYLAITASTCGVTPTQQKVVQSSAPVPGLKEALIAKDRAIQAAIITALRADPILAQFKLKVEVHRGRVILSGVVAREKMKEKAEELARATEGVKEVLNQIEVDESLEFMDFFGEYKEEQDSSARKRRPRRPPSSPPGARERPKLPWEEGS